MVTQLRREETRTNLLGGITIRKRDQQQARVPAATTSLLLPVRTCKHSSFPIPRQKKHFVVEYQCSGTEYDNFTAELHQFMNNESLHSTTWGRRPWPLPSSRRKNSTSVLFLGNSHTKQTVHELVCQYSDQLVDFRRYNNRQSATSFHFSQDKSIYLVYNSQVEIALDWVDMLKQVIKQPLNSFDAVVLGQFNGAERVLTEAQKNTFYYQQMMEWAAADRKHLKLDNFTATSPNLFRLSQQFSGPIVFLSSYEFGFSEHAHKILEFLENLKHETNRTNLYGILSRKYIDTALGGNECGCLHENRKRGGACERECRDCHRCVGLNGGHPTLIAHDVQEALYSMLE